MNIFTVHVMLYNVVIKVIAYSKFGLALNNEYFCSTCNALQCSHQCCQSKI